MSILIKGIEMPKEPWECPCHNGENGRCNVTQKVCVEIPKDCPLVSVPTGDYVATAGVPKRGKWRKRKIKEHQFIQNGYELYYCSECYKNYSNTVGVEGFDYCPNCGARMESDKQ